jgi:DNA sulfur modification protein DndE
MTLEFKELVWKGQFRPTEESRDFEEKLRGAFGLSHRYEAARLLIGRSLRETKPPDPLPGSTKFYAKPIPGEYLFGDHLDLWLCALILDGNLRPGASVEDFRSLVEAHWARGFELVRNELDACEGNEIKLVQRLADLLPEGNSPVEVPFGAGGGAAGEIRLKVGTTHPGGKPVDFVLNGPGTPPHIALMGAIGKGKTTTGVQIALELVRQAGIPLLFIDPKGEFVKDGQVAGLLAEVPGIRAVEMGNTPCLLDFLPSSDAPTQKVQRAAMRLRDTIALCCKSPGDLQKDLLRTAIQDVISNGSDHSLETIRDTYERHLMAHGKNADSIVSRLNELTGLACFDPQMPASQFFSQSWVISLKGVPEELKRLSILMILDATSAFLLDQEESPAPGGFRVLRHLLILDEARKVLQEKKFESLVDLIRVGRSKGASVMLLSQDPSDFDGAADDFLTQIETVVAFACSQNARGLGAMRKVFKRVVQTQEFSDTQLTPGLAFVKLPGREAERIRCWQPEMPQP